MDFILKRFEAPDETRQLKKGKFEVIRIGGMTIGRATYEPGWKWSEHVGAEVGASRCNVEHIGLVLSGTATAAFDDGRIVELRPGQLFYISAVPHDSWVIGNEPYVSLHFLGADKYARTTPEEWHSVTPRIVVNDARRLVEFLHQVFNATGEYRENVPSEVRIGDSLIMITDAGIRRPMTAFLYVYVDDTDTAYRRALAAGARSLEEPTMTPYGDRRSMVEDQWGNTWQIATKWRSQHDKP